MDKDIEMMINAMNERLNNTHWGDLTLEEINLIEDNKKRREFLKNWDMVVREFVNPLVGSSNFRFKTPDHLLTCRIMVGELMELYKKKGYSKEEIYIKAAGKETSKKY